VGHRSMPAGASSFHIGENLGDLPVADSHDVDSSDMPATEAAGPAHHRAIAAGEHLLTVKDRRGTEELRHRLPHRRLALVAFPVRGRREGLPPETMTAATRWIAAGAAVGGCSECAPSDIAAITDIAHTAARPG
jgi:hypothetical protein